MSGEVASVASEWAAADLKTWADRGLTRELEPLGSPQGPVVEVAGRRLINFSSNDYLGLAGDARLAAAATRAFGVYGTGAGASRLLVGDSAAHHALERRLAAFTGAPAVRLFNSGYAANTGVLAALVGEGDALFSDALNHASLIDGCRLSRARTVVYPHADVSALNRLLSETPARRKLVVTDAVFSMDGDRAPLAELVGLCRRHGAGLMLDEAHAVGVLGPRGDGLAAELGLEKEIDVRMGTLGKAMGAFGAFVAADEPVVSLLTHAARPLVFSTALPPALCAAAEAALEIVESDGGLRARLWRHVTRLSEGLRAPASSAIFPVPLGTPEGALAASAALRERGLLVKAIRPPTVPAGQSRLRIALSAAHAPEHVDALLDALSSPEVRRAVF